jgi:hypothetical protein
LQQDPKVGRQVISVLEETSRLLREIEKIAIQGKIRTKNQHHEWRYGTINDRAQKAIQKTLELRKLAETFDGGTMTQS